jgi:hypothetical protein
MHWFPYNGFYRYTMAVLNFEVKSATEAWLLAYKAYQRAGVRLTMLWMHHAMVYRTRNRQPAAYEVDTATSEACMLWQLLS